MSLGVEMKTLPVKRTYVGEDKSVDPRPRCANDDDVYLLDYHFTRLHSGRGLACRNPVKNPVAVLLNDSAATRLRERCARTSVNGCYYTRTHTSRRRAVLTRTHNTRHGPRKVTYGT